MRPDAAKPWHPSVVSVDDLAARIVLLQGRLLCSAREEEEGPPVQIETSAGGKAQRV